MSTRLDEPELFSSPNALCLAKCETLAVAQWFTGASPWDPPEQRRRIYSDFRSEVVVPRNHEPEPLNNPGPLHVPTTTVDESEAAYLPKQTPFLFCDTSRTHFSDA